MEAPELKVEVAYAGPDRQLIIPMTVPAGTTAREAVERSGMLDRFPEISLEQNNLGIFGAQVAPDRVLEAGDRVEIYRPLQMDPREARRRLAAQGRTMQKKDPS